MKIRMFEDDYKRPKGYRKSDVFEVRSNGIFTDNRGNPRGKLAHSFEVVTEDVCGYEDNANCKMKIRMLKNDYFEGFRNGDVFDCINWKFTDKNGRHRRLSSGQDYEVIHDDTPHPHPQEAYNVTPDTKYLLFAFERSLPHTCIADAERHAKALVRNGVPLSAIKVKPVGEAIDLKLTFGVEEYTMIDNATKGEWVASFNGSYWQVDSYENGKWITGVGDVCATDPYNPHGGEQEANANLFAASKEMYEALIALTTEITLEDDEGLAEFAEPMRSARAALAKAEGLKP